MILKHRDWELLRFKWLFLLAMLSFATATAWCGDVVTNATDLLPYLGFNGKERVEFAFKGTVVRSDFPHSAVFYAKTPDGYVRLVDKVLWPQKGLSSGDIIDVRGKTLFNLPNGYVNAYCFAVKTIGHVKPDPPVDATIEDILDGKIQPLQTVRIRGTLRDAFMDEIDHRYWFAIISSGANSICLSIQMDGSATNSLASLIGAEVRATVSYNPLAFGTRRLCRTIISLRSPTDIEIISPPPQDPFDVSSIESIHASDMSSIMNLGRHIAKGTVIAVWQHGNFAIRTERGEIVNVSLAEGKPPNYGDAVEAAGLPYTDLYRINLRRAIWRKRQDAPAFRTEEAKPVDATALFTDGMGHYEIKADLHGKAISMRGIVTGVPSVGLNDGVVRLQCGEFAMPVDASATPDAVKSLEIGCEAEISGTCIVKTDSWHPNEPLPHIREVVLVVRTPADVKVLASPPWWTPGKFAAVAGMLVAVLAVFLLWNIMLKRLADKRGLELASTRILQEESKLKVQERTRIAVELHDTVAQNLTGVSLEIDSAEQLAEKDHEGMLKHLGMAARTLQSCRNELRNCLWDLRSRALEEADLNEAIRRTVTPLVSDVDLAIRFNVPRKALSDDIAHVLMRIVRELVQNAVRHGDASQVKIAGSLDGAILRFSVSDNGCGFDPATRPSVMQGHFGLQGIHERVNQLNGDLSIESAPGKGAKVSIRLKV